MIESLEVRWQGRRWDLPPLILHPFGGVQEAAASFDSIKLALHLAGLGDPDLNKEQLLRGRYAEFRMLCLAGKDVMRWMAQCEDFASRDETLAGAGLTPQSFADLLVNHTPAAVGNRFESWGVLDYRRILTRAIGINAVFPGPPAWGVVSAQFLEEYYSYADQLFLCYQRLTPFVHLPPAAFEFLLYTSDEYMSTLGCAPEV